MALQGTLDTFSLPDVLRLLATTSKTGRLRIEGDRGRGSVWLADGRVVDAAADRSMDGTPVEEVVFELLRFGSGSFAFDGDDLAADAKDPEDVDGLLRRANSLLSEWSELENVVPSLEHEVSLANDLSVDEVTIDADRWKSLVALASGRTVGELASMLSLTELGVSRAVRDLVDLGVAEVDVPGTAPDPAPRQAPSARDLTRRPSAPRPELDGVPSIGRQTPLTGETPRAGWYQTGEMPAIGTERRTPSGGNGHGRASLDDTVATPPPPPAPGPVDPPPGKGGLSSRLGRNRNAAGSRGPDATGGGATSPATGATPATPATNGTPRPTVRPSAAPPARTNDSGRPRNGSADTAPTPRVDRPSPRRPGTAGPSRSGPPPGPGTGLPDVAPPFDGGRLGPSPDPRDTGQIRPITPSSLPPDLHWAADDTGGGSIGSGLGSSPFSGLSSLGPSRPEPARPPARDGEIAPHVAAMSPEARSAVQSTVGNAGGSTGARAGSQGEDIAQRGRLISFLSTVR